MNKILAYFLVAITPFVASSQDCSSFNTAIDVNYTYGSSIEDFEMPMNNSWSVLIENREAMVAYLQNESGNANVGIIKNRNGYHIDSAHDIGNDLVLELVNQMVGSLDNRTLKNVRLKNLPAKEIEYDFKVENLGDTFLGSGVMYMIVRDGYTYVFMFNCHRNHKRCYIPFFKNVIKSTFFGPDWY